MNWQNFLKQRPQNNRNTLAFLAILLVFVFSCPVNASSSPQVKRFEQYLNLKENMPETMTPELLHFISDNKPLSNKLRRTWLLQLAEQKDWTQFLRYYQSDNQSTTLSCYAAMAHLQAGSTKTALAEAEPLWLVGTSQVKACDPLFSNLLKHQLIHNQLIEKRIVLALEKRNINLARYLLKQLHPPRLEDASLLLSIYRSPEKIKHLKQDSLHGDFYLYGLKRLVSRQMDTAIHLWQQGKSKKLLTHPQQQAFLAHVALYKAMRDQKDANHWFDMIEPKYYNEVLLQWQIRHALKHQQWRTVLSLLKHVDKPDAPGWQYWHARALKGLKKDKAANKIFNKLAKNRHYYGFLASIQVKKPFQFESESRRKSIDILKPYQPILDSIAGYYRAKKFYTASSLINDLSLELNDDEHEALAIWAAEQLKWYGKSVYLTNINDDLNDQLSLRFPLAYRQDIIRKATKYHLSPAFVYAIIRQESAFRHRVTSRVGARGLMQIMPQTASMVAKRENIPYHNRNELFTTSKNIQLGTAYLNQLNKRFNGHPTLMAAAYNAGPHQVDRWLKKHSPNKMDIWIETLPFHETRNYLKNIIAFYAVYQYRMKQKPQLKAFLKPVNKK